MSAPDFVQDIRAAVQQFWVSRTGAGTKHLASESADRGERANVTSGKHLDGFADFITRLVEQAGISKPDVKKKVQLTTLPGFFRPTKKWDVIIHSEARLIAVIELKSHVGPSFGNNCNNRAEEALGNAVDFWTAHREGAFGKSPRPFLGYVMLLEDCPAVHAKSDRLCTSYFNIFPEFRGTTYADRYRLLCEKLMLESLYTSAAVLLSPRTAITDGAYSEMSEGCGMQTFLRELRGKLLAQIGSDEQVTVRIREEPAA